VDNLIKVRPGATVQPHVAGEAPQGGAAGAPKAPADNAKAGK
jgi:hypothetical protein